MRISNNMSTHQVRNLLLKLKTVMFVALLFLLKGKGNILLGLA